jgi:hypothetical protein
MLPAGFLLKRVLPPPGWLADAPISDVCSVSDCTNDDNVVDVQELWLHNGFGVANDPETLWSVLAGKPTPTDATLFYYEAYEQELPSDGWTFDPDGWRPITSVPSAGVETKVAPAPADRRLLGYDVVVSEDYLEHSPLSCNSIAKQAPVNRHCLFDTFEAAKTAIDSGAFGGGCEEGIYRIYSVNVVPAGTGPGL